MDAAGTVTGLHDGQDLVVSLTPPVGNTDNPNQWFVFAFSDVDLPAYVRQQFKRDDDRDREDDWDR
jgi:hypothetical protein